ncbi:MAG TPA: bifunctional methylenetetrahydrofolate dehydrogenase/methenyltetrahydrofolate cyclohydrolase FolD [Dongiaceae bacterium]|jgi:methylenetetrahydrofolate dehydrogenase (NADP+)/methenyltetrahydrofolate cyclohydrolase|nr:bifunctional methylenetetrahydrofolate dehydrogenase/methenyltetrahydrofolate cyclohydrolase FolD [Dongiaceae bacterium]
MNNPRIIDGKAQAQRLRAGLAQEVRALAAVGVTPGLAVVLVGDDPASHIYVRRKGEAVREVGMASAEYRLPVSTSQAALLALIRELNGRADIHGILVQLPLPASIDQQAVIDAIDPRKDVDGFHVVNAGLLATGGTGFVPCTPLGCLLLLKERLGDLTGKRALILGRSNIVGKPMAQLLLRENCTVTIAHSRTRALAEECRRAEILVAAIGKPHFVQGDWLDSGATVIDVGINRTAQGKIVGDVDTAAAVTRVAGITPVPGGVGPMTIACLLLNTLEAARKLHAEA